MQDIVTIISTLGFPIFAFLATGLALKFVYERERRSLDDTIEKITNLTLAVNNNSDAIRDLAEYIKNRG